MRTLKHVAATALAFGLFAAVAGCGSTSSSLSTNERDVLRQQTADARQMFMNDKPATRHYFDTAHAYVIFPSVKSGAVIVGGAGGDGEVYEGGKLIGTADLSQANIGAQLGGQEFAEVIFFENAGSLAQFTQGTWEFDAKASAVAGASGGSNTADYEKGVRVFTLAKGGLMAQAAIGTQKLRYRALGDQNMTTEERNALHGQ